MVDVTDGASVVSVGAIVVDVTLGGIVVSVTVDGA